MVRKLEEGRGGKNYIRNYAIPLVYSFINGSGSGSWETETGDKQVRLALVLQKEVYTRGQKARVHIFQHFWASIPTLD